MLCVQHGWTPGSCALEVAHAFAEFAYSVLCLELGSLPADGLEGLACSWASSLFACCTGSLPTAAAFGSHLTGVDEGTLHFWTGGHFSLRMRAACTTGVRCVLNEHCTRVLSCIIVLQLQCDTACYGFNGIEQSDLHANLCATLSWSMIGSCFCVLCGLSQGLDGLSSD